MRIVRFLLPLFLLAALGPPGFAQQAAPPQTLKAANQCARITVTGQATVGIQVTGTFSMTLQPEVAVQGQAPQDTQVTPSTSTTPQSTITTAGVYAASAAGYDTFLVCVSSYVSGSAVVYLNSTAAVNAGLLGGAAASAANFGTLGSGTNTAAAMVASSGSSLTPAALGQVSSTGDWDVPATGALVPPIPTLAVSNTGGGLVQDVFYFRITYVGPSTIVPSGEIKQQLNTTNCASDSTCQITVTMPTSCTSGNLPSGVTGCTVWDGTTSNAELQQAASNACVNITSSTCVVDTKGAGSMISSPPATTGVAPSSITAITQPDFIVPNTFMQIADGTYVPVAGIDYTALNGIVGNPFAGQACPTIGCIPGTFTWTHRFFFNDTNDPPIQANNFVSIHHLMGQTTGTLSAASGAGLDDRAFGVEGVDTDTVNPYFEQSLTQYNERIITNNNFYCAPVGGGAAFGETCAAAGRFILSDIRPAATRTPSSFFAALAGVADTSSANSHAYGSCGFPASPCIVGIQGGVDEAVNNQNGQGGLYAAGFFGANGASSNTNGYGAAMVLAAPVIRFASGNYDLIAADSGSNALDFNIFSYTATIGNGKNYFAGGLIQAQPMYGTVIPSQLVTPTNGIGAVATCVSTCTATYMYKIVTKDMAGGFTAATTSLSTGGTAATTLDASDYNTISVNGGGPIYISPEILGRYQMDVYRTSVSGGSPSTTGYIGTTICPFGACHFVDNGIAVTTPSNLEPAPPSVNTSGAIAGYTLRTLANCVAAGTAASTSVVSCGAAPAGMVYCDVDASAATCVVDTTAVTTHSTISITPNSADGTPLGETCNTAMTFGTAPILAAKSTGVSFTINMPTVVTNGACFEYSIIN